VLDSAESTDVLRKQAMTVSESGEG
jgi:hypothetical protein